MIGLVVRKELTGDCSVALGWATEGRRKRGRPKTTWRLMVVVERNVQAELSGMLCVPGSLADPGGRLMS